MEGWKRFLFGEMEMDSVQREMFSDILYNNSSSVNSKIRIVGLHIHSIITDQVEQEVSLMKELWRTKPIAMSSLIAKLGNLKKCYKLYFIDF